MRSAVVKLILRSTLDASLLLSRPIILLTRQHELVKWYFVCEWRAIIFIHALCLIDEFKVVKLAILLLFFILLNELLDEELIAHAVDQELGPLDLHCFDDFGVVPQDTAESALVDGHDGRVVGEALNRTGAELHVTLKQLLIAENIAV